MKKNIVLLLICFMLSGCGDEIWVDDMYDVCWKESPQESFYLHDFQVETLAGTKIYVKWEDALRYRRDSITLNNGTIINFSTSTPIKAERCGYPNGSTFVVYDD